MNLYSLTLQQTTGIQKAIHGNFSAPKAQEIIVSKVKHLELLRINEQTGKLQTVLQQEVFGLIRCMQSFRLPGSNRDQLVIGCDSGRVVIISYDGERNAFVKVFQETYGKTGCRRIVPGQMLACDPKGRAFMLSAIEKNKFVYIFNRESDKISISSPLEAPKSHTIVFDIMGLDSGYDNAMFAALEVDYGDWQDKDSCVNTGERTKFLTIYEMDFGLNTVKRRTSDPVDETAHQLVSVPCAPDGPGGVIILCEDFLIYRGNKGLERRVPYPRRMGAPGDRGVLIGAVGFHKQKDKFLYLLQNEFGDLFEMQIYYTQDEVHNITLQYIDTIPVAVSLCILKSGYLFAPCERGNHGVYKFISSGKEEANPVITNATMKPNDLVYFVPHKLMRLSLKDEISNFSCITALQIGDLVNEGNPQIYTLCAAGSRSTLRVLRHGLGITQLANTNLQVKPQAIWTIKAHHSDEYHKYIILSFVNHTLVLSIGQKVEEAHDHGLDVSRQSLHVGVMEDGSTVQVISNGIRHIKPNQTSHNILLEGKVIKACSNPRQVALGLAGGEIYYFELDHQGQLVEIKKEKLDYEITALELGQIEEGRQRCSFMAIGLSDHTVRLVTVDPENCLDIVSTQALPSLAESLCMMEMINQDYGQELSMLSTTQLFLFMGLNNGVILRSTVDTLSGQLSDTRTRYLGTRQVKCFRVWANGSAGMLALSSRPWLCYTHTQRVQMQPLSYDQLDYAASFNTKEFVGGIVGISGITLRIIAPQRYGELFNQTVVPLSYSPRKMVVHEDSKNLIIIESDNRAYCQRERLERKQELFGNEMNDVPDSQVGYYAPMYHWAACCRLLDPRTLSTIYLHEFENNEHAVSVTFLNFAGYEEQYLCIGTVKDLVNEPTRKFAEGFIHTFTITPNGKELTLLHSTNIDEIPYALSAWRGRLLVGAGSHLRAYEMGKKRLLKKAELKNLNSFITNIHVHHDRIFVTELSDSVHLLRYRIKDQTFMELADDILPRWVTASCLVDYHTVVAADKFENIFITRVPLDIDEEQEDHPFEFKMKMDQGCMNGAPFKMDQICNFFYGEIITTLQKSALVSTGNEVVVFATSMGAIGALFAFDSKEDIDFFLHLEMYLRAEQLALSGRDHMMFRSFYGPCKNVIDGDLCEQFFGLPYSKQKQLAEEFDRQPADIKKKLEDVRYKIL